MEAQKRGCASPRPNGLGHQTRCLSQKVHGTASHVPLDPCRARPRYQTRATAGRCRHCTQIVEHLEAPRRPRETKRVKGWPHKKAKMQSRPCRKEQQNRLDGRHQPMSCLASQQLHIDQTNRSSSDRSIRSECQARCHTFHLRRHKARC